MPMRTKLIGAAFGLALVVAALVAAPALAQKSVSEYDFSRDSASNAIRTLAVDAAGGDGAYELVFDTGSRECVGYAGQAAIDLRRYRHAQIIATISAFDNGGGATLNTQFTYNALAPDGATATVSGFVVGGAAFAATGSKITTWEPLSSGAGTSVVASTWTSYGISPPPYITLVAPTNSGTTTSITCRIYVFARP